MITSKQKSNYIKTIYNEKERPWTQYPKELCTHLFQVHQMVPGMKLLEVGCGRGEFINNFKKLGLDVSGIDVSHEASEFQPEIPIKICDVEKEMIPYPEETFDIVFSKSLIEHLSHPQHYLNEACRVLKSGGLLLTLVPDWESNYKIYFDDFTHRTPFTIISLSDIYKMFGLKKINVVKFRQLPVVWKYPFLNYFCAAISPFIPVRTKVKFFKWSRELMLSASGIKP